MVPRYYLEFDDPTGTNLSCFATFRLRGTWAKRLRKGMVVYLANSKDHIVYGRAKVDLVLAGPAMAILEEHAYNSHLELAGDFVDDKAAERRFASMQKRYGPHKMRETSIISVIYLRRTA